MNTRIFLLLERLQKLDSTLRLAQLRQQADPVEIALLRARKRTVRERLSRLMPQSIVRLA